MRVNDVIRAYLQGRIDFQSLPIGSLLFRSNLSPVQDPVFGSALGRFLNHRVASNLTSSSFLFHFPPTPFIDPSIHLYPT